MESPKVFISYSHDSIEHKKWVLEFATRLRSRGVDAILDQWDLGPGGDLPSFMESGLRDSDRVLIICTDTYVKKANAGEGGVGYEKMIMTPELMKNIESDKIIPIIRQGGTYNTPTFIGSKLHINFSDDNNEPNYDNLLRTLLSSPLFEKPPIGNNPFGANENIEPRKTNDPLKKLIRKVVEDYEKGESYSTRSAIDNHLKISRIMIDILIQTAINKGLIRIDSYKDLRLTDNGKIYAIKNKLTN